MRSDDSDVSELAREFARLEELENELSLAQRWVHGRMTNVLDRLDEVIGADAESRFYANVLAAIATGDRTPSAIGKQVDAPNRIVEEALHRLAERGLIHPESDGWQIS